MAKEREKKKLLSSFDSDKMSSSQKPTLNHKDGEKEVLVLIIIFLQIPFLEEEIGSI